ncbi:MAG: Gfo/Idh/MocA family oxidoreductase [Planctomycetaceae bacterium]|jgi:predicted dehydrogenase|nr:Gfo/Idh/MocA family oxidoreductase [Planctomycetaceae bacterium]
MVKNFGIIGCGMIASFHAKAIREIGGNLVACFDHVPQSSERIAKEYGAKSYIDLNSFLTHPNLEIVTIGTPSGAHCETAVAAAEAGKHVIVEKPLEITLERCDKIIAACDKAGITLSTIFPSRFHDSSRKIKKAIESGRFGKLTIGDAIVKWYRTQEYYDSGAWRGTWELDGGGALMNQAIHSVDLLTWLMGPVVEVNAVTSLLAHERIAVEDTAAAAIRFQSGALGIIEATTAAYPGYLKRIEIHGSTGSAVMEEEDIIKWDFASSIDDDAEIRETMTNRLSTGGGAADPAAIGYHAHARQFRDVLDAIDSGRKPLVDGHEGRKSVEIILAIYAAAEKQAAVTLPLGSDPILHVRTK